MKNIVQTSLLIALFLPLTLCLPLPVRAESEPMGDSVLDSMVFLDGSFHLVRNDSVQFKDGSWHARQEYWDFIEYGLLLQSVSNGSLSNAKGNRRMQRAVDFGTAMARRWGWDKDYIQTTIILIGEAQGNLRDGKPVPAEK